MRQFLLFLFSVILFQTATAQDILVRVRQTAYSSVDPDGVGPAVASVSFRFELRSSAATVLADGMGLSVVFQSTKIAATPTNTTLRLGPINTGVWTQGADNRAGNVIAPVNYGGQIFDRRMIVSFNQNSGVPDAPITTLWTPVAQLTYYVLDAASPQGGYITPEPGTIVAQNELSSDGGLTTYPYLSTELNTPVGLSSTNVPLPVLFTKFDAQCQSNNSVAISWGTSQETNSSYFEVEKSINGVTWTSVAKVSAAGTASTDKNYQVNDPQGGIAQYRLKQVDKDGKGTYSATVKSSCESRNTYVTLYPVPARDVVTLIVGADKAVKTSLQVFDTKGQVVVNMPVTVTVGTNTFRIPLHKLAAGEYILRSNDQILQISKRFTIIR